MEGGLKLKSNVLGEHCGFYGRYGFIYSTDSPNSRLEDSETLGSVHLDMKREAREELLISLHI